MDPQTIPSILDVPLNMSTAPSPNGPITWSGLFRDWTPVTQTCQCVAVSVWVCGCEQTQVSKCRQGVILKWVTSHTHRSGFPKPLRPSLGRLAWCVMVGGEAGSFCRQKSEVESGTDTQQHTERCVWDVGMVVSSGVSVSASVLLGWTLHSF